MKVLISGAGVAGLTLAHQLTRHGITPTVVEKAPGIRDGGYKVDIRGAALDVVRSMGILDELRRLRTGVRSGSVVDTTGKRVASMDADTFGGRVHDDAEVLRGDLLRMLFDLTATTVDHRFGDSIVAIDDTRVTFASGGTEEFDVVVGADGVHSATRALAFGPEEQFVRDLGYRIAIYSAPNHLGLDREELTYIGPGRTALVYSTTHDATLKAMFLFAGDAALSRQALREAYATEGWEVPRLLDGLDDTPDFYADTIAQVHMDRWSAGRVVLLGDAAHCASPASGQGTSLALVGGYLLAGELAAASGDFETAFRSYEERMRPFALRNQELGPANIKRMVMGTRTQVRMSMLMLGLMARLPGKERLMAKVIEPIHRAATAITLPVY
ncbi:FAD-dependent monooxygenase [Actinoplanes derwentensis]|uniref:2-polyprenyl-6-methoxyphenol hydroxylase n=1 Tax=Actinoplanes derwentensis TaxID=113562 RepID=A0A1H1UTD3_9ACTN|nr:FAD-dependent monooxygenase [Actinoplanes derwentensis]GID88870.1 FAD-dependent oxidoreductase [Actinoplanes derwentensis]SDS75725.1 2-polyprenyl-6-methoxyphenol hydroxylase [Actinoplanes derwentensis]